MIIIENAILKIGSLLILGLGEAGAEIIANNFSAGEISANDSQGTRTYGIFGFCDIRNFTDSTEVLQEDVMVFTNTIADIVHSVVDK